MANAKSNPTTSRTVPAPRKGMPSPKLDEAEFKLRYLVQFVDPAFDPFRESLSAISEVAWQAYVKSRKSPLVREAGAGYADPDYELSVDWLAARTAIEIADRHFKDPASAGHVLVINSSPRSEHTCPGEMSKSYRLAEIAMAVLRDEVGLTSDLLDLSRLTSEYGRNIYPCKACFSTAAPLCHWPCSCYPNYSLGQTRDWMSEIYPLWVSAHGVMLISPVNWYQVSSPLKLMMDRLVCADGGNPDPTSTHGKDAARAKAMELAGWSYPRHLAGRVFSVIVHGDVEGAENVRRSISDWLRFMQLEPAGPLAEIDRYIGYWEPYATSHEALDADHAMQDEVRNAARALAEAIVKRRSGQRDRIGAQLTPPRQK